MGLLGDAALVMWMDTAPETAPELEDWHSHEHMPERLRIPGFLRGSRWSARSGAASYFVMYEVLTLATVASAAYAERLAKPTPWSRKMFAHFRGITRSPCRIAGSFGLGLGSALLTLRFAPLGGERAACATGSSGTLFPGSRSGRASRVLTCSRRRSRPRGSRPTNSACAAATRKPTGWRSSPATTRTRSRLCRRARFRLRRSPITVPRRSRSRESTDWVLR